MIRTFRSSIFLATRFALLATPLAVASCYGDSPERSQPREPQQALEAFEIAPSVRIELVASEPQVVDPVAIRFDEDGRLWVVEMRDYPDGPPEGESPTSRISILEDHDGDGQFETSTVFADQLIFPTGLQPWRGGVIVTLAGEIVYMKDTDGDGRADLHETWFTGFAQKNTQLRANNPTLGLDRYVYVANGLRGAEVRPATGPDSNPLVLRSHDFRFDPVTKRFEAIAGNSQFGMTLDSFGNRFLVSNRNPLMQVVVEDRYASRNPHFALPAVIEDVAVAGVDSRVYPIARSWTTSLLHAGQFTAACGTTIYRGDRLPGEMYGNAFTCEPTGSLVHREVLQPSGATFQAKPGRDGVEFLASRDEWFRPVNLTVGPDGALYIADMYRAVIEHPQWMPDELRKRPDLRDGDDRGRIYRVVASDASPTFERPQLSSATDQQLTVALARENAWWRETAARLLLERASHDAARPLRTLAREADLADTRLAALHVLSGLELLSPDDVRQALADEHPGVRQQAIVFAERWPEELRGEVVALAGDSDPKVRFQVALSLAPVSGEVEIDALKEIALLDADDSWTRDAVSIAAAGSAKNLLLAMLNEDAWVVDGISPGEHELITRLADLVAATGTDDGRREIVQKALTFGKSLHAERLQQITVGALFRSMQRRGKKIEAILSEGQTDQLVLAVASLFQTARQIANQENGDESRRLEAIALIGHDPQSLGLLADLASTEPRQSIRLGAIAALAIRSELDPWNALLDQFPSESPAFRSKVLGAVVSHPLRATLLLDTIEAGRIRPSEVDRASADALRRHRDETVKQRANKILAAAVPQDRAAVLADYQVVLEMPSDPKRGREIFRKNCATCHQVANIGVRVGPDVGDNYARKRAQLLTDILQPNRAIDANFMGYLILTQDGRTLSGLLAAESANSITLLQEESKSVTLTKSEVEEIQSSGISLMPDGMEKNISHQDMADLLSFLKNWRYLDGRVPYVDQAQE